VSRKKKVVKNLKNSDALHAARRIADHAVRTGVLESGLTTHR
jgi:hypothetical protein